MTHTAANCPSVSIIITNHDYGHFLPACLESIRRQAVPPDQVIVVDDGSTDASRAFLAGEGDVEVILQDNHGQAGAFNAGFRAASGDVIVFLDADDQLQPNAVDLIKRLWTPTLALLSFDMTLIDGDGRATGRYPIAIPDRDLKAQLRERLLFPFMPTSGNAFGRERLAWAFPLPEARWKISADTLLVRAAMLSGAAVHVRHALGRYTAHGQNNFYAETMSRKGRIRRALIDVADAGLDLLDMAGRPGAPIDTALRADLARAALEVRLRAHMLLADRPALRAFLGRLNRLTGPAERARLPRAAILACLPSSTRLVRWIVEPGSRPRGLSPLFRRKTPYRRGPAGEDPVILVDQPRRLDLPRHLDGLGWVFGAYGETADLCEGTGGLRLRRLAERASLLRLTLRNAEPGSTLRISLDDAILALERLEGEDSIEVTLPAPAPFCPEAETLHLECTPARSGGPWRRPARRFTLEAVDIAPAPPEPASLVLPWSPMSQDTVATLRPGETVRIALPDTDGDSLIRIAFGPAQPVGRLTLGTDGERVLDAWTGPGKTLYAEIPYEEEQRTLDVALGFRPSEPLAEPLLDITALDWAPGPARLPTGQPVLSFGKRLVPPDSRVFIDGWSQDDDHGMLLLGQCGEITFALPALQRSDRPALRIDLELLDPLGSDEAFALVATNGEETLATANLRGRGQLDVPVPPEKSPIHLYLHASPIPPRPHSGLKLHGIELVGGAIASAPERNERAIPRSALVTLLERIATPPLLAGAHDPATLRRDALACIDGLSDRAANTLTADALSRLAAFGAGLPTTADAMAPPTDRTSGNWLRWLSRSVLSGPAWQTMADVALTDFAAGQPDFAAAIGQYLAASPVLSTASDAEAFSGWAIRRHREAKGILTTYPKTSWHYLLARDFVRNHRPIGLYFQDWPTRDVVAAISTSIETLLLREGHDLPGRAIAVREPQGGSVTRLAVLLRHAEPCPETWILRALLSTLDRSRIEVTVFLLEASAPDAPLFENETVVTLGKLPLGAAVAEIRSSGPDIALIGAAFLGYSPTSTVAAHRLAPRQIALSAISPVTTGFRSVDEIFAGDFVTPSGAEADYTEKVVRAPGTGQIFDFGPEATTVSEPSASWRARLGIGQDATVMVSGAMHDKIVPDLLDRWIEILSGSPGSVLLLYPFARNWARQFDTKGFLERIHGACEAAGIASDRIHILGPIDRAAVRTCLAHADLYLDSFPYSGATTVVEALAAGLPVVTRAGASQRCHQGSGWLNAHGLKDCIAQNASDYVEIATRLANDRRARARLQERIHRNHPEGMAQADFREWFARQVQGAERAAGPRYLFHHMPKAGGTSTRKVFSRWFRVVGDYREPWATTLPKPLDLATLAPDQMLAGHFAADNMPLDKRYPETRDPKLWRKITFVRDPLDLALSIYFFERARRGEFDATYRPLPLGDFLRSYDGLFLKHFECDAATWRDTLDSYWFIGTLERLGDCIAWLGKALDKPAPDELPVLNVTDREETPDPDDVAIFVENNRIEFEMYRYICRRISETLGEPPLDRL